jgi:hypothetical protein
MLNPSVLMNYYSQLEHNQAGIKPRKVSAHISDSVLNTAIVDTALLNITGTN